MMPISPTSPSAITTPLPPQATSPVSTFVNNLCSLGNTLIAMITQPFYGTPHESKIDLFEESIYPRFRENAEIRKLAKKWETKDIPTVKLIVKSLPDYYRDDNFRISDLSYENIYLHRAQPLKYTDLKSRRIANKTEPYFYPGNGIFFLISLKKKECNPYAKSDSIELVCHLADVLRCGGKIIDDPYSFTSAAIFIRLPENESIPFELAKDL